jgi:hypothetical protein
VVRVVEEVEGAVVRCLTQDRYQSSSVYID